MSTILKRFEIWCLFVLVFAGIWWAFQLSPIDEEIVQTAENSPKNQLPPTTDPNSEGAGLLEVKGVNVSKTDQGMVVELTLFGHSGTDEPVTLGEDTLELLTSEGEGVHRFFLPFNWNPMLSNDEKSLVTVRYWLVQPVDVLWLTYRGHTMKVEIPSV